MVGGDGGWSGDRGRGDAKGWQAGGGRGEQGEGKARVTGRGRVEWREREGQGSGETWGMVGKGGE